MLTNTETITIVFILVKILVGYFAIRHVFILARNIALVHAHASLKKDIDWGAELVNTPTRWVIAFIMLFPIQTFILTLL